jgi:uncharacterized protein (DUF849 family)
MKKTIVTVAVTGSGTKPDQTPYLPITPEQIATSAIESYDAGASVVHIHVRDPATGVPSMKLEYYEQVVTTIRSERPDMIINLTTGPGGTVPMRSVYPGEPATWLKTAEQRTAHIVALKPEICSLDFNTMNRGPVQITVNAPNVIREMIKFANSVGCKPELEIFDSGDFHLAKLMIDEGLIQGEPFWQFAMGVKWGWSAQPETLDYARRLLPPGSNFSAFGLGPMEMPIVAQSYLYGGHVRVGMEDNIYLERGVLAEKNSHLVAKAVRIIKELGGEIATPAESREIIKI